jgi:hypothetical protein
MDDVYYSVEVRDDHDGGSVWYVDEDYMETLEDARELAIRRSLGRDNGLARVKKVTSELVAEFKDGES